MKKLFFILLFIFMGIFANATQLLIPMDEAQKNHLKAYGIAYWVLENNLEVQWLLNYRGGSFMMQHVKALEEADRKSVV